MTCPQCGSDDVRYTPQCCAGQCGSCDVNQCRACLWAWKPDPETALREAIFERLRKYARQPITPELRDRIRAEVVAEIGARVPEVLGTVDIRVDVNPAVPGQLLITAERR